MTKCKYYKNCKYHNKDSITCRKDNKKKNYCRSYRQKRLNEKLIKKRKKEKKKKYFIP